MSILRDVAIRAFLPPSVRKAQPIETRAVQMPGSITLSGSTAGTSLNLDPDAALTGFQASEVDYQCAMLWATELAARPLILEGDDGIIEDDVICNRFNSGSSDSESALLRNIVLWMKLEKQGESFIFMDRGANGQAEPKDFLVLMDRVEPLITDTFYEDDGFTKRALTDREKVAPTLAGFRVHTEFGPVNFLPSQILWLRYPDFQKPWQPVAPGSFARLPAMLDEQAREWQYYELKNGARPSGIANLGSGTNEESAQRYKAQLEAATAGAVNAGRVAVVGGGEGDKAGFSRMSLTPQEMSYIESHGMNGRDICTAYGIPVDLIFGQSTFDNQEAAWQRFWARGASKLKIASSEIQRQLWPDSKAKALFDVRDVAALQENTDAVHARAKDAWLSEGLTYKEYRAAITAEPLEENDPRNKMTYTQLLNSYKQPVSVPLAEGTKPNLSLVPDTEGVDEEAAVGVRLMASSIAQMQARVAKEHLDKLLAGGVTNEQTLYDARTALAKAEAEMRALSVDWNKMDSDLAKGRDRVAPVQQDQSNSQQSETLGVANPLTAKKVLAAYDRHERSLKLAIQRLAEKQQASVLREAKKTEGKRAKASARDEEDQPPLNPALLFVTAVQVEETKKALHVPLEGAYTDAAFSAAEALGLGVVDEESIKKVTNIMLGRLNVLAGQITDTTYAAIQEEVLKPGIENGEALPKLTKRLTDRFDDLKTWRAEAIARTESVGAKNEVTHRFNEDSGLVKATQWVSTPDERTRISHKDMNGEEVPLGQTFSNGCRFPGDPLGLPKETIQCRCVAIAILKDDE